MIFINYIALYHIIYTVLCYIILYYIVLYHITLLSLSSFLYFQTGSRYLHINVEVRPTATKPQPLTERKNTFSLDALPDGSKMVTVRLQYQSEGYERTKPQLNQLYVDAVHLLQVHTNFNELPHATDYLRAVARCLEAGYFRLSRVDSDTLTLMRALGREIKYVHQFQPDRPVVYSHNSGESSSERSYAQADDFVGSHTGEETQGGEYVRFVPPEEGRSDFAARVDEEGRLNLVKEPPEPAAGQQRNAFSVRVSADADTDNIRVKISDDDASMSQTQSFSVRDSSSEDSVADNYQDPVSVGDADWSTLPGDESQSDVSGSPASQSDSSSHSFSQSDSSSHSLHQSDSSSGHPDGAEGVGGEGQLGEREGGEWEEHRGQQRDSQESATSQSARTLDHRPDDELWSFRDVVVVLGISLYMYCSQNVKQTTSTRFSLLIIIIVVVILLKGAVRDFHPSSRCRELSPTPMLKWPWLNCVEITNNTSSTYQVQNMSCVTWHLKTAQLLSLTGLKSHLFLLYFITWNPLQKKEGRRPEYREKPPNDVLLIWDSDTFLITVTLTWSFT